MKQWTEKLKAICFERQIRCMDVDYCTMKEPCEAVLSIYKAQNKKEIQSFEASEVETYKCESCGATGQKNWKLGAILSHHEEVGGWEATCRNCKADATIFND